MKSSALFSVWTSIQHRADLLMIVFINQLIGGQHKVLNHFFVLNLNRVKLKLPLEGF